MQENEYRVLGPPGTGKTTYLSEQITKAIRKYGSEKIIATSFTRAAAVELVGRELPIPDQHVGTLHRFGCTALGINPRTQLADKNIKEWNKLCNETNNPQWVFTKTQSNSINEPIEKGFQTSDGPETGEDFINEVGLLRNKMIGIQAWKSSLQRFYNHWCKWKTENDYYDFTDMIEKAYINCDVAPFDPDVIFVDEAQDLTPLQAALIRKWGSHTKKFILCGDDDQAIYSFTGATHRILTDGYDERQATTLKQSYRLPKAILNYSQKLICRVKSRIPKEFNHTDREGSVNNHNISLQDTQSVLNLIYPNGCDHAVSAGLKPSPTVFRPKQWILISSSIYMLNPMIKTLRDNGIPYYNPYRKSEVVWNPLAPTGYGVSTLQRLLNYLWVTNDYERVNRTKVMMWNWEEFYSFASKMKASFFATRGMKTKLKEINKTNDDKQIMDYEWVKHIVNPSILAPVINADVDVLVEHCDSSIASILGYFSRVFKGFGWSGLIDNPNLIIGTIHSVKGGESDNVIICPDLSAKAYQHYQYGDVDDLHRLFYVGVTRARENLHVLEPSGKQYYELD